MANYGDFTLLNKEVYDLEAFFVRRASMPKEFFDVFLEFYGFVECKDTKSGYISIAFGFVDLDDFLTYKANEWKEFLVSQCIFNLSIGSMGDYVEYLKKSHRRDDRLEIKTLEKFTSFMTRDNLNISETIEAKQIYGSLLRCIQYGDVSCLSTYIHRNHNANVLIKNLLGIDPSSNIDLFEVDKNDYGYYFKGLYDVVLSEVPDFKKYLMADCITLDTTIDTSSLNTNPKEKRFYEFYKELNYLLHI